MNGIINVLKPPGMSSSGVVVFLKRLLNIKKIGHTGTLDPGAAGVLVICLNRATRLFDIFMDEEKEYIAEIKFGISTDTQDLYGYITGSSEAIAGENQLLDILPKFTGEIEQITPIYSAAKQQGKPLYSLARQGLDIREKKRLVTISGIEYLGKTGHNRFLLSVKCSKGTYIRTLISDIGEKIGIPSVMSFLLRTKSGEFYLDKAYTIDELKGLASEKRIQDAVIKPEDALLKFRAVNVTKSEAAKLKNGCTIVFSGYTESERVRVFCDGSFLGLADAVDGNLKIIIHLGEVEDN
ncbi:MAG: tRNA pseudouridine(55) synthase TruB [Eubacteriales bacterium]